MCQKCGTESCALFCKPCIEDAAKSRTIFGLMETIKTEQRQSRRLAMAYGGNPEYNSEIHPYFKNPAIRRLEKEEMREARQEALSEQEEKSENDDMLTMRMETTIH